MNNKLKKNGTAFDALNAIILGVLALIALFPFYNVLIISLAKYEVITDSFIYLLPASIDFTAYKYIITEKKFLNAFLVSSFVTVFGVAFNMTLSVVGAYGLSKKKIPGRNFFLGAILFTMFFNGGLIPYYLVVNGLGLVNNILVMIIPNGIATMYLIIMKNYFATIPESMEESAKIDGANDLYILWKIIIPISAPFIATFALFYAVDRWNEWWNALIFINESNKAPLQIFLREILIVFNDQIGTMGAAIRDSKTKVYMQGVQMAAIVVTALPIICIYPFLQKHFVSGIMIGSIKE
jgi:putative aldouronate transport system permease protein